MDNEQLVPDPQQLRAEAQREPSRRGLQDYTEVILMLKDQKGFSFREIATWLQERGLNCDHNAVWRAYAKLVPPGNAATATERSEQLERHTVNEASMPWLDAS